MKWIIRFSAFSTMSPIFLRLIFLNQRFSSGNITHLMDLSWVGRLFDLGLINCDPFVEKIQKFRTVCFFPIFFTVLNHVRVPINRPRKLTAEFPFRKSHLYIPMAVKRLSHTLLWWLLSLALIQLLAPLQFWSFKKKGRIRVSFSFHFSSFRVYEHPEPHVSQGKFMNSDYKIDWRL